MANPNNILVQGPKYEPVGDTYSGSSSNIPPSNSSKVEAEEQKEDNSVNEGEVEEVVDEVDESSPEDKKKKLLLIAGAVLAGTVVLIVLIIVSSVYIKKKQAEDDLRRANELLEPGLEIVEKFAYTRDELDALRAAGYTGDEIELYQFDEVPADKLIAKAEQERKSFVEKEILPYFDAASDEFKELYDDTWIGQGELVYDTNVEEYTYHQTNINVDYKKLPARGRQLFIKLYLKSGNSCFMYVTPERYAELDDEGNIVVNVRYTKTGDGSMIITQLTEIIP